jgi:hypothetical protein
MRDQDSQASKTTDEIKTVYLKLVIINIIMICNFTFCWQIYSFTIQRAGRGYADRYPEFLIYDDEMCHEILIHSYCVSGLGQQDFVFRF